MELTGKSGVYQIRNLVNSKVYAGSTEDFRKRWARHKACLRGNCHDNLHLQCAWNKYGEESFFFGSLQECEIEDLLFYEQLWMDCLRSHDPEFGYNICKVAGSTLGIRPSFETRKKISDARRGHPVSEESKRKMAEAQFGEKGHNAKLTWERVRALRLKYLEGGCTQFDLAKEYGVAQMAICRALRNETWKDESLGENYFGCFFITSNLMRVRHNAKLTWKKVHEIREKYSSGVCTQYDLAKEYEIGRSSISNIISNKTWREEKI